MTTLPESTDKKLGLVIDLDTCVGCHACVISCKGRTLNYGAPLSDQDPYGRSLWAPSSTACIPSRCSPRTSRPAHSFPSASIAMTRPASRSADRRLLQAGQDGIVLVNEDH